MGYQDRDYRKESLEPPTYINIPRFPLVYWLIILCALLSIIETDEKVSILTDISYKAIFNDGHIWAIFLSPFAPDFFMGALCHCLALYFIGRRFIQTDGAFEFLTLYFVSALIGMAMYWGFLRFAPQQENFYFISQDAAEWSLCGIAMVYAVRYPTEKIMLFFVLPIQIRMFMTGVVVIVFLRMASSHVIHALYFALIGSLGFGFLVGYFRIRLTALTSSFKRMFAKVRLPLLGGGANLNEMSEVEITQEVDRILDKITAKGFPSLSSQERDFLMKYSKRKK